MRDEAGEFICLLRKFVNDLGSDLADRAGNWLVKGFIDAHRDIYTISCDTKVISKIIEIQLFPKLREFADSNNYDIILAAKQNWYPDLSFVSREDSSLKFAVDIKTTYRLEGKEDFCNGFTLGSHGEYFRNRKSSKNVQYPYGDYVSHICLGILYTRAFRTDLDDTRIFDVSALSKICSVIKDMQLFVQEKWKIASDRSGSGNTANIGSVTYIPDVILGNGTFIKLGEKIFDEYWINHGVLQVPDIHRKGAYKKLTKLSEFLVFKGLDCD